MEKKQIFQVITEKTGLKKWLIITILIVVSLVLLGLGGNKGWRMYDNHLKAIEKEKLKEIELIDDKYKKSIDSLVMKQDTLIIELSEIRNLQDKIPNFNYRLNKANYENAQLRKMLQDIVTGTYSQYQLDSIARNITYD